MGLTGTYMQETAENVENQSIASSQARYSLVVIKGSINVTVESYLRVNDEK